MGDAGESPKNSGREVISHNIQEVKSSESRMRKRD